MNPCVAVTLGVEQLALVTEVAPDGKFFVQLDNDEAYGLSDLSSEICLSAITLPALSAPAVNMRCYAHSSAHNLWFRGIITDVKGSNCVVFYVDYGNTETLPLPRLRCGTDAHFAMLYQAVCCQLIDFLPTDGDWGRVFKAFQGLVLDNELTLVFHMQDHTLRSAIGLPCYRVTVLDRTDSKLSITRKLVDEELGQYCLSRQYIEVGRSASAIVSYSESPDRFWIQLVEYNDALEELMASLNSQEWLSKRRPIPFSALSSGVACCVSYDEDGRFYRGEITKATASEVTVLYVDYGNSTTVAPSAVLQLAHDFVALPAQALQCQLDGVEPVRQGRGAVGVWSEAAIQLFADKCSEEELDVVFGPQVSPGVYKVTLSTNATGKLAAWLVLQKVAEVSTKGIHTTGGTPVQAPSSSKLALQPPSESSSKLPPQSSSKPQPSSKPPSQLSSQPSSKPPSQLSSQPSSKPSSQPPSQPSSKNPSQPSSKLPSQTPSQTPSQPSSQPPSRASSQTPAQQLVALQPPQHPKSTASPVTNSNLVGVAGSPQQRQSPAAGTSMGPGPSYVHPPFAALLKSKYSCLPFQPRDENVYVFYAESPSAVWCQLIVNTEVFKKLMDSIARHYLPSKEKCNLPVPPRISQPCCVQYREDQSWCRGLVIGLHRDKEVEVLYVDYGSVECMAATELKELAPEFLVLPAQATCVTLHGVFPKGGGTQWSPEAVARFSELCVTNAELKCTVVAGGSPRDGRQPSVKLRTQQLDIGDLLVKEGLGEYREGPGCVPVVLVAYPRLQLKKDQRDEVAVSHVTSLSDFYCQLLASLENLESLTTELQEYAETCNPQRVISPQVNTPVLAKYSEDGMWYRAVVVHQDGERYKVLFVDFGNMDEAEEADLLLVPPSFLSVPACAVRCALVGNFETLPLAAERFTELSTVATFQCTVVDVSEKCSVELSHEGEDILQLLERDGCVRVKASKHAPECARESGAKSSQKAGPAVQQSSQGYPVQRPKNLMQTMEVAVSHVNSLSDFFCQSVSDAESLDALTQELQEYADSPCPQMVASPLLNTPVLAKYSEDGLWYRALISVHQGADRYTVFFVDFGNTDVVSVTDLVCVPASFLGIEPYAFKCSLEGCRDTFPDAQTHFSELAVSEMFKCVIKGKNPNGSYIVELRIGTKDLLHQLEEEGHGKPPGVKRPSVPVVEPKPQQAPGDPMRGGARSGSQVVTLEAAANSRPSPSSQPPQTSAVTYPSLPMNQWCEVSVSYLESPMLFYVQLVSNRPLLVKLATVLNETALGPVNSGKSVLKPEIGALCCAQFTEDKLWYRARIMSLSGGKGATVIYLDYGNSEVVDVSSLKVLSQELVSVPSLAIPCQLVDLNVPEPSSKRLAAEFAKLVEVEPLKAMFLFPVVSPDNPARVKLCGEKGPTFGDHLTARFCVQPNVAATSVVGVEPPLDTPTTCFVAYIEDLNKFYCHLASNSESLGQFTDRLQEFYSGEARGRSLLDAAVGNLCVAMFDDGENSSWYRAKVTRLDPSSGTATVYFVDYGNSADVPVGELMSLEPDFASMPAQAIYCSLQGAKPPGKDKGWSEEDVAKFDAAVTNIPVTVTFSKLSAQAKFEVKIAEFPVQRDPVKPSGQKQSSPALPPPATPAGPSPVPSSVPSKHSATPVGPSPVPSSVPSKHSATPAGPSPVPSTVPSKHSATPAGPSPVPSTVPSKHSATPVGPSPVPSTVSSKHSATPVGPSPVPSSVPSKHSATPVGPSPVPSSVPSKHSATPVGPSPVPSTVPSKHSATPVGPSPVPSSVPSKHSATPAGPSPVPSTVPSKHSATPAGPSPVPSTVPSKHSATPVGPSPVPSSVPSKHSATPAGPSPVPSTVPSKHSATPAGPSPGPSPVPSTVPSKHSATPAGPSPVPSTVPSKHSATPAGPSPVPSTVPSKYSATPAGPSPVPSSVPSKHSATPAGPSPVPSTVPSKYSATPAGPSPVPSSVPSKHSATPAGPSPVPSTLKQSAGTTPVLSSTSSKHSTPPKQPGSTSKPPVSPTPPKSPFPREIAHGSKHDVIVVTFHSPDNFYCTAVSSAGLLGPLMEEINHLYAPNVPTLSTTKGLKEGMTVLAQFTDDDVWYRARIVAVDSVKDTVEVWYIDYGNREVIPAVRLKKMDDRFMALEPQGVKCQLHNPKGHKWSDSMSSDLFRLITEKGVLTAEFVLRKNDIWEVNLFDRDANILQAFIPSATMQPKSLPSAAAIVTSAAVIAIVTSKCPVTQPVKHQVPSPKLALGSVHKVYLTNLFSPAQFWCQPVDQFEALVEAMFEYCNGRPVARADFVVGDFCLVFDATNEEWCRAKVVALDPSSGSASVLMVDYGTTQEEQVANMFALTSEFALLPAQAFCCCLDSNETFSQQQVDLFLSLDLEQEYSVKVLSCKGDSYVVDLVDHHGTSVIKRMLEVRNSHIEAPPPLCVYKQLQYSVGTRLDVYVSHVDSPSSFFCQPLELAEDLDAMMGDLKAAMTAGSPPQALGKKERLVSGQPCAATYSEDGEWYRARVEQVMDGDQALVTFVDYGNSELASLDSIAVLPLQFLSAPVQAIECSILDLSSSHTKWSDEQVAEFASLIQSGEHITLQLLGGASKDGVVKLVKVSDGKGEIDFSDLTRVGQKVTGLEENGCGVTSSLSNVKSKSPSTEGETESEGAEGEPLIKAPFQLNLVAKETTEASVVFICNPNLIYVQRVDCADELTTLSLEVEEYCANFAKAQYQKSFSPGDFVLACYSADSVWYRAKVVKVHSDTCVEVFFIDYGNTEEISPVEMVMCPENFLELPAQAIPCSLAYVPNRDSWPADYKTLLSDLVEEKVLRLTVEVPASQGMIPSISLVDPESAINVSDAVLHQLQVECDTNAASTVTTRATDADNNYYTTERKPSALEVNPSASEVNPPLPVGTSATSPISVTQVLNIGQQYTVSISELTSLECFSCTLVDDPVLAEVRECLDELYSTDGTGGCGLSTPPQEGDYVCAQFTEDLQWYRAQVEGVEPEGLYGVCYVDFGNAESLPISALRVLDQKLLALPCCRLDCFLSGVDGDVRERAEADMDGVHDLIGEDVVMILVDTVGEDGVYGVTMTTSSGVVVNLALRSFQPDVSGTAKEEGEQVNGPEQSAGTMLVESLESLPREAETSCSVCAMESLVVVAPSGSAERFVLVEESVGSQGTRTDECSSTGPEGPALAEDPSPPIAVATPPISVTQVQDKSVPGEEVQSAESDQQQSSITAEILVTMASSISESTTVQSTVDATILQGACGGEGPSAEVETSEGQSASASRIPVRLVSANSLEDFVCVPLTDSLGTAALPDEIRCMFPPLMDRDLDPGLPPSWEPWELSWPSAAENHFFEITKDVEQFELEVVGPAEEAGFTLVKLMRNGVDVRDDIVAKVRDREPRSLHSLEFEDIVDDEIEEDLLEGEGAYCIEGDVAGEDIGQGGADTAVGLENTPIFRLDGDHTESITVEQEDDGVDKKEGLAAEDVVEVSIVGTVLSCEEPKSIEGKL